MSKPEGKVLNIAHRGARSLAPENTLAAALKGFEAGADLWETDVVATCDGQMILFHDDSLVRTTDARERFPDRSPWLHSTFTLEEILTLDAGIRYVENDPFGQIASGDVSTEALNSFHGLRVPTLKEGLAFTSELHWRVNLELKHLPPPMTGFPLPERVLDLLDDLRYDIGRVIISSFNHDFLRRVRKLRRDIAIHALVGGSEFEPIDWGNYEFDTYNANYRLIDETQIARALEHGVTVNLWTVNDTSVMKRFMEAGVSGFFTDFPQRLAALLKGGPPVADGTPNPPNAE